jgi:hypothetical protein
MAQKRIRLSEQSIAGIKVAKTITLRDVDSGGYRATAQNEHGQAVLRSGSGEAVYSTIAAARRAVHRHNPSVTIVKEISPPLSLQPKKVLPPESLRSPKDRKND